MTRAPFSARTRRPSGFLVIVTTALLSVISPALCHDWTFTTLGMLVGPDGTYEMDLYCDFDGLLLGLDPGHLDDELWMVVVQMDPDERRRRVGELRERLARQVVIRFDGQPDRPTIDFPEMRDGGMGRDPRTSLPGSIARFRGRAPEGATAFTIQLDPLFGPVMAGFRRGGNPKLENLLLAAGVESAPFPLHGGSGLMGALSVASGCLKLGFHHILPAGLDHVLLVLGLYLLNARLRSLVAQVGVFVLANTAALALAVHGLVSLPIWLVEPVLSLAVVYLALENAFSAELKPWRSAMVFGLGLLHGLASSGTILELGLSPSAYPTTLIAFNAGLGLGLMAVVGLALLASGWFRSKAWYRQRIIIPASLILAAVALIWTVAGMFAR